MRLGKLVGGDRSGSPPHRPEDRPGAGLPARRRGSLPGGVRSAPGMNALGLRAIALLCAPLLAVGAVACGNTVETGSFKGEELAVANAIANLKTDMTAGEERKVCTNDLASEVAGRLSAAHGGCQQVIKNQLAEVDNFELSVQSVQVSSAGGRPTATAQVKSTYSGKTVPRTVSLVKEGGKWKVASVT
jgi:hypothetical protein